MSHIEIASGGFPKWITAYELAHFATGRGEGGRILTLCRKYVGFKVTPMIMPYEGEAKCKLCSDLHSEAETGHVIEVPA